MVHLIHRKRVPLLHNTILILCVEGDGLVAVMDRLNIQIRHKFNLHMIFGTCHNVEKRVQRPNRAFAARLHGFNVDESQMVDL